MSKAEAKGTVHGVVAAKVIRADGTEEDLGIISVTDKDAERIIAELKALQPEEPEGLTLEQVNAMHEERSAANDEESQRIREADTPEEA